MTDLAASRGHVRIDMSRIARAMAPIIALVAIAAGIGTLNPNFLTLMSLQNLAADSAVLLILATGQTLMILTGRVDLSVGALASLSSILIALWHDRLGWSGVALALAVIAAIGAVQGTIQCIAQIQSFVVTIGGLFLWSGVALIVSNAKAVPVGYTHNIVKSLGGDDTTFGAPHSMILALAILVLIAAGLRWLPAGRKIFALGVSERAAILSGLSVNRLVIGVFTISALCSGIAGVVLVADFSAGRPGLADALLLPTIAAVVVGGTSITGGVGGLGRTLIGVLIIALLRVGINVVGAPPQYQQIVYGVIVILAVTLTIDRAKLTVVK
jgi:ribose transport system permease protein